MYNIENYSLVQICRSGKTGGGVAIYVKNCINYAIRNVLTFCSLEWEGIFTEVKGWEINPMFLAVFIDPL